MYLKIDTFINIAQNNDTLQTQTHKLYGTLTSTPFSLPYQLSNDTYLIYLQILSTHKHIHETLQYDKTILYKYIIHNIGWLDFRPFTLSYYFIALFRLECPFMTYENMRLLCLIFKPNKIVRHFYHEIIYNLYTNWNLGYSIYFFCC